MNAIIRAQRARRMLRAGRIGRDRAYRYVMNGMDPDYAREWPQAAHDWALRLLQGRY